MLDIEPDALKNKERYHEQSITSTLCCDVKRSRGKPPEW